MCVLPLATKIRVKLMLLYRLILDNFGIVVFLFFDCIVFSFPACSGFVSVLLLTLFTNLSDLTTFRTFTSKWSHWIPDHLFTIQAFITSELRKKFTTWVASLRLEICCKLEWNKTGVVEARNIQDVQIAWQLVCFVVRLTTWSNVCEREKL